MSCNHCGTKFNIFHKELGCANCGLSLCSKCLQQKSKIPSKGSGEFKVCRSCYSKLLNGSDDSTDKIMPPDRFLKRLENLENPAAPPIIVYRQNPKMTALKSGLSSADQVLVDRLEKLKEKQPRPPSDSEIRDRLAKLKGNSAGSSDTSNRLFYTPDMRTDQEKTDSLLEQYANERVIDASHQPQINLAQRLATLKGEEYKENKIDPPMEDEEDSEEEVDQITKKIVSEVSLEERCPIGSSKRMAVEDDGDDEDLCSTSPELPWCVLCNGDAKYRCLDCGGDLYCHSCNIEVHKNWGDTDHKVVPYQRK